MEKLIEQILNAGLKVVKVESDTSLAGSFRNLAYVRALGELMNLLRTYHEATKK